MKTSDKPRKAMGHRLRRLRERTLKEPCADKSPGSEVALELGWGRLIFGQTFGDARSLIEAMRSERPDGRDIAFYVRDPQVVMAAAPQELFLDPSHTYRLDLATYRASHRTTKGFFIRRLCSEADANTVNTIYAARGMVPVEPSFFWRQRDSRTLTFLVAEDEGTGQVIGAVTGVDHRRAFEDPERGSSLWCLAVDPLAPQPGIGEALVRRLSELFQVRGAAHMDLSVLHNNESAIALYEKLGFKRTPFFTLKRKNTINQDLYMAPPPEEGLNPYARFIVDEARRRGIGWRCSTPRAGSSS